MTWLTGPASPVAGLFLCRPSRPCAKAISATRGTMLICSALWRLLLFQTDRLVSTDPRETCAQT
jgi:hypothetical protein